jgi:hypothetical protein
MLKTFFYRYKVIFLGMGWRWARKRFLNWGVGGGGDDPI